jgi:hypothetical protein
MEYHESKVKDLIREACYKAIEIYEAERAGLKSTGNPYATIASDENIAMQINGLTEQTFNEIKEKANGLCSAA